MATVDGLTKERMLAIEAESITAARLDPVTNHLIFTTHGGTDIDVGNLTGPQGPVGPVAPAGAMIDFAAAAPPAGWLLCDGSAVSRTTYATLFGAIGTTWGVGDGSTTFNLPDFRGRSTVGAGTGAGLSTRPLGQTGGEENHILTAAEGAIHSHTVTDPGHSHPITDRSHIHTIGGANNNFIFKGASTWYVNFSSAGQAQQVTGSNADASFTGITGTNGGTTGINGTNNAGNGTAHNTMHPFAVVTKIIKT